MDLVSTYVIPERLGKSMRLVRSALDAAGLEVAGELDIATCKSERCRVLLVDSPLLSMQALALDRAAGVYLPLHLMLREENGRTHVGIASPAGLCGGRLPAGAAGPIARMEAELARALDGLALCEKA